MVAADHGGHAVVQTDLFCRLSALRKLLCCGDSCCVPGVGSHSADSRRSPPGNLSYEYGNNACVAHRPASVLFLFIAFVAVQLACALVIYRDNSLRAMAGKRAVPLGREGLH